MNNTTVRPMASSTRQGHRAPRGRGLTIANVSTCRHTSEPGDENVPVPSSASRSS